MNNSYSRNLILLLTGLIVAAGCGTANQKTLVEKKDSTQQKVTAEPVDFFPVTNYLLSQMSELSKSTSPITRKENRDSTMPAISLQRDTASLHHTYAALLNPIIDSTRLGNSVTVVKFMDETLHAITLSYDLKNKITTYPDWNSWIVYINPETSEIKKIYLTKLIDASHRQQITWTPSEGCLMRTFETDSNGSLKLINETIDRWAP